MVVGTRAAPVVVLVVVMSLIGMSQASATIEPVKIFGGRTDQFNPGANGSWIGWTANSVDSPTHYDAFVRPLPISPGAPKYQLNATKQAIFGGITPDTNEAVVQQFNNKGSDLHVYDLTTGSPVKESDPVGLNTSGWEAFPAISKDSIMFLRKGRTSERLLLFDRNGVQSTLKLDEVDYATGSIEVGNVTENYATWTKCVVRCNVFYYDITGGDTYRVPNPNKRFLYAGSTTDATGQMYFVRSGTSCGAHVTIRRWLIGSASTTIVTVASLPDGYDVLRTFTFNDGSHDNVYFDRLRCGGTYYSDIYEVPAADTG